jgi:hypothetical protein
VLETILCRIDTIVFETKILDYFHIRYNLVKYSIAFHIFNVQENEIVYFRSEPPNRAQYVKTLRKTTSLSLSQIFGSITPSSCLANELHDSSPKNDSVSHCLLSLLKMSAAPAPTTITISAPAPQGPRRADKGPIVKKPATCSSPFSAPQFFSDHPVTFHT